MEIKQIMLANKSANWKLIQMALSTAKKNITLTELSYFTNLSIREIQEAIDGK